MTPADLVYYPDSLPGIRREKRGRGFSYIAPDGTRIDDTGERSRLDGLAVPPAYEDVWICPRVNGHLQATGRDARSRKQYRYHPDWTAFRARRKYEHLAEFGHALPSIRRRISRDLGNEDDEQAFAIAAVMALMDRMSLRIGHPDYAAENGSYGATTLRRTHVSLKDGEISLSFPGKSGNKVRKRLRDARLEKVLHRFDDLPGTTLIGWTDGSGNPRSVTSDQINALLHDITGSDHLTAKTFRTWNGSVAALKAAAKAEKITIKLMAEAAAERLANTPSIARNSYIHPDVIALAEDPAPLERDPPAIDGLRLHERRLLDLLG